MESQQIDVLYGNYEEFRAVHSVVGWPEFLKEWNGQDSKVARGRYGQNAKSRKWGISGILKGVQRAI